MQVIKEDGSTEIPDPNNKHKYRDQFCRTCNVLLTPENAYQNRTKGTLQVSCKKCGADTAKKWRDDNRDKERQRARNYYAKNRESFKSASDRARVIKKYGLTPEQITEMKARQGGLCYICQDRSATSVDHCHATGSVRAMLCKQCNTTLGFMKDSPITLRRAADYLEEFANKARPTKDSTILTH